MILFLLGPGGVGVGVGLSASCALFSPSLKLYDRRPGGGGANERTNHGEGCAVEAGKNHCEQIKGATMREAEAAEGKHLEASQPAIKQRALPSSSSVVCKTSRRDAAVPAHHLGWLRSRLGPNLISSRLPTLPFLVGPGRLRST